MPGCRSTAATVTISGQAQAPSGNPMASRSPLVEPTALLMAPLIVGAVFGRKRKGRYWAWPVSVALLAVALVGFGATLAVPPAEALALSPALSEVEGEVEGLAAVAPSEALVVWSASPSMPASSPVFGFQQRATSNQPSGTITVTHVITYTYDPLNRLTGAEYSTGESFAYAYDAVGNRAAYTETTPLAGTTVTTYTYDAANRLLVSLSPSHLVSYGWDARGNLTSDGTFTYAYNGAGRLVRAESVTMTLVYTYTADGLRVAQAVNGSVMTTTWDVALGLAQVLATSDGALDIYGLGRIGEERDGEWAYSLPDALGSVRQWTDSAGAVTYAAGYTPYGEELWHAGGTESAWGFTGEWWDANVGLEYLRARWYSPSAGRFTSRDPIERNHPYLYASSNPILYTDASGLSPSWWGGFYPGYIETMVGDVPLFGIRTHGQENWLEAAVNNVPAIQQLYVELKAELMTNAFSSGTVRELYEHAREKARVLLDDDFACIHYPDLEYAHAALIVLAYIPANFADDINTWKKYPLFIPDDRREEPGWDKAGHFFLNAFTAFEGKYSREYYGQVEEYSEDYDIAWMGSTMNWIIGGNNIAAIEAGYLANDDVPYIGVGGLTGYDAALFNNLVTIGNAYELLTSLNHLPDTLLGNSQIGNWIREHGADSGNLQSRDLLLLMLADRILNGGGNINALVEALLQQPRVPERNEGLLDIGVYRDQVANRLGINFGIQVFNNPATIPVIPYDVGKVGCQRREVGGEEVYYYAFP